jgi:hypothetical protein
MQGEGRGLAPGEPKLGLVNFFFLNFRYGPPPLCPDPDERRFRAWCASLILVLILGFEVQQYSEQSVNRDMCMGNYRKCTSGCVGNSRGIASHNHS